MIIFYPSVRSATANYTATELPTDDYTFTITIPAATARDTDFAILRAVFGEKSGLLLCSDIEKAVRFKAGACRKNFFKFILECQKNYIYLLIRN